MESYAERNRHIDVGTDATRTAGQVNVLILCYPCFYISIIARPNSLSSGNW